MRKFEPKMKDGFGNDHEMSPEAHQEWKDKGLKHSVGMDVADASDGLTPSHGLGKKASNFEPMKGPKQGAIEAHEKAQIKKGMHAENYRYSSAGAASVGHKSGPTRHAGKGAEGMTKGPGGKGKLNSGNGYMKGKKVKGL